MPYKNKTYVCFDGDTDMNYYRLMQAWKSHEDIEFDFHNAHDLNSARDSSQEESIKRQLRERFANSKLFVVLIGEKTKYLTKFVKWEIETAIKLDLPIIGVNLNKSKARDDLCPPVMKDELAIYVPYEQKIMQFAMKHWPTWHPTHKRDGKTGHFYYEDHVYQGLK